MDSKQAKKLKIGDRLLIWSDSPHACSGTVIETGYCAVKIKWDDEEIGVIHINDMTNVSRFSGAVPITPLQPGSAPAAV